MNARTHLSIVALLGLLLTSGCDRDPSPAPSTDGAATRISPSTQPSTAPAKTLSPLHAARKDHVTKLLPVEKSLPGPPDPPPADIFKLIRYPAPAGDLAAYLTPDPADGKKRPALVWAHGGFSGIGSYLWEKAPSTNDQSVRAFLASGELVVMCPSWRGENDNPGQFEAFWGEVDDALAAVQYLRSLPHVDPNRVYFAGHSTGGTLALLAVEADADHAIRAAFSFGGAIDMREMIKKGGEYGPVAYDPNDRQEKHLRSPIHFVRGIRAPTFYFEGENSYYPRFARAMDSEARLASAPFRAFIVDGANHFNILRPLTALVARKIKRDTGPGCDISITEFEVNQAYAEHFQALRDRRIARRAKSATDGNATPPLSLTPAAAQAIKTLAAQQQMNPAKTAVRVVARQRLELNEESAGPDDAEFKSHGVRLLVKKTVLDHIPDTVIEYVQQGDSAAFKFIESPED